MVADVLGEDKGVIRMLSCGAMDIIKCQIYKEKYEFYLKGFTVPELTEALEHLQAENKANTKSRQAAIKAELDGRELHHELWEDGYVEGKDPWRFVSEKDRARFVAEWDGTCFELRRRLYAI